MLSGAYDPGEGVEGTHIPCSLGGGSGAKPSGQESWPQDALSDALPSASLKKRPE